MTMDEVHKLVIVARQNELLLLKIEIDKRLKELERQLEELRNE